RRLVEARTRDLAAHAKEFRARRALGADATVRGTALAQERRHVHQGLDVVHDGRPAEEPDLHRKRRLVARLAALALDRVEQRRLLAAGVGAGAPTDLAVQREARAHDVSAQEAGGARGGNRAGHALGRQRVLTAQIEVAALAPRRVARDGHALDQRERILLHQETILERPGLGLV